LKKLLTFWRIQKTYKEKKESPEITIKETFSAIKFTFQDNLVYHKKQTTIKRRVLCLKIKTIVRTKLLQAFEMINHPKWKEYRGGKILKSNLRNTKKK
jgi:phage gpG-like protein